MSPHQSDAEATSNPNADLSIPKWINEKYFEDVLVEDVPNYQRIVSFKPIAATAPGDNFTSIMVRVLIDVELKNGTTFSTSYILKTCLEAGEGAALVASMNLFPREKQMYQTLLPKFEQLYKEAGLDVQFGPKCLRIDELPEGITLVLEDLKIKNFENTDRLKGMNMEHATQVLRKIAELHAASAVYYEMNGPYDEIYMSSFFSEANRPIFEAMGAARIQAFIRAMRTWGLENVENYIENMPHPNDIFDEAVRMNDVDPNEFNVLNHGDCWSNNVMFKHKPNYEIDETLFVDFQVGKWGTPAQDLWYYIVTSTGLDIKVKEFDRFIYIYHKRLAECLKKLKYSKHIPTLKEIHILMLKYGYWGILTANGTLSVVLLPTDKEANINNMLKTGPEGEELRFKIFSNPIYAKANCQLYPFFEMKGLWLSKKEK